MAEVEKQTWRGAKSKNEPSRMAFLILELVRVLTQKHKDQIEVQEVREADRGTDGFWKRNAEEFSFIEYGNGLNHSNS